MATRRSEWLASIKPILDRDEAKKDAKALAQELGDILEVKVDASPENLDELAKEFNAQLKMMGKQPIVFSDKTLRGIVSQFSMAITAGIKSGIDKSKFLLKDLNSLQEAYGRNKNASGERTGKRIRSGFVNQARGAFDYEPSDTAIKIGNNLRAITNEFNKATSWEEQYVALLKYIKAYEKLESVTADPKSLEKWATIGDYAIQDLKEARPGIEHSLQNIFQVAYGKAVTGLTDAGDIDVGVELTPIKIIDVYDVTGGKGSIEVEVKPIVKKAKKNETANAFRGVHKPSGGEGRYVSRALLGGDFWTDNDGKALFLSSYGEESGESDAKNLSAVLKPLNRLVVDAEEGGHGDAKAFNEIDQLKFLQRLLPGIENFVNTADTESRDYVQKFYNEMARQAGFDLFEVTNVNEGADELATTLVPLQDRIIEWASKIPDYYDVEKFTPEMERDIISRQKGSSERWYTETITRLESQMAQAVANDDITEVKYLQDLIPRVKEMYSSAMANFDEAIASYGGYIEDSVLQGLPEVISANADGKLIPKLSAEDLKNKIQEFVHLSKELDEIRDVEPRKEDYGNIEEFNEAKDLYDDLEDTYQQKIDLLYNQLINGLPNNLQNEIDNLLIDAVDGAVNLEDVFKKLQPHLTYDESVVKSVGSAVDDAERKAKADKEAAEAKEKERLEAEARVKAEREAAEAEAKARSEAEAREKTDKRRNELAEQLELYNDDEGIYNLEESEDQKAALQEILNTLKQETLLTDELQARYDAINSKIDERIGLLKSVKQAYDSLETVDNIDYNMYDVDEVQQALDKRKEIINVIPQNVLDNDDDIAGWVEEIEQGNLELEKRIGLLQQVKQGIIDIDSVDDILSETGDLDSKLSRLGDVASAWASNIKDSEVDDDDDAIESLQQFEETYDRIVLKLANGRNIEILPNAKGLRALYKYYDGIDSGSYGESEIEDVSFERVKREAEATEQAVDGLNESLEKTQQLTSGDGTNSGVGDASLAELEAERAKSEALQNELDHRIGALQAVHDEKEMLQSDLNIANEQIKIAQDSEVAARARADETDLKLIEKDKRIQVLEEQLAQTQAGNGDALFAAEQRANEAEEKAYMYDRAMTSMQEEMADLRGKLADAKTGGGKYESVSSEELKNVLNAIVYNVKIAHDDNGKTANKIALDDSTLETTLTKVFANILNPQTQQNDGEQTQKSWALESTLQIVKGVLDNIQIYTSKIGTVETSNVDTIAGTALDGRLVEIKSVLESIENKIVDGGKIVTRDGAKQTYKDAAKDSGPTQTAKSNMMKSLISDYKTMGKLAAQFATDGNLETKAMLDNLKEEIARKRQSLKLTMDENKNLREKYSIAFDAEKRLLEAEKAQEEIDKKKKQDNKDAENAWKKQVKDAQRATGINAATTTANAGDQTVVRAIGTEGISQDIENKAKELSDQIKTLRMLRDEIDKKGNQASAEDRDNLSKQIVKVKELKTEVDGYLKIHEKYSGDNVTDLGDASNFGAVGTDQYWNNITEKIKNAASGRVTIKGMNADTGELTGTTKIAANTFAEWSATVDPITGKLSMLRTGIKKTETIVESITRKTKEIFTYFSGSSIIFKVFNELKKGVQYVRDIDLALTELKKVTDETDETYEKFLKTASKTATKVGSTIKEVVSSTADFARLGYTLSEATTFAESAQILMNVSEFTDISRATDTLISSVQAFGYTADTSMEVVDLINTIGNNYAISTADLAQSLTKSSASLVAAGGNLAEAAALTATANKIIQDADSVGTALKTTSLRLRGTDVKILEEEGLDSEGAVTSKSKLQSKVKALSGVDILTATGEYKSTYEILSEIADVWSDINDMDQAALLELISGKRNSSVIAAILQNPTELKEAFEDANNASGSALKENEKYLDSIQGKIDQFNNAVQTLWSDTLDSDVIKFFVDLATQLVKIVDAVGPLNIALVGMFAYLGKQHGIFDNLFKPAGDALEELKRQLAKAEQDLIKAEEADLRKSTNKTAEKRRNAEERVNILKQRVQEASEEAVLDGIDESFDPTKAKRSLSAKKANRTKRINKLQAEGKTFDEIRVDPKVQQYTEEIEEAQQALDEYNASVQRADATLRQSNATIAQATATERAHTAAETADTSATDASAAAEVADTTATTTHTAATWADVWAELTKTGATGASVLATLKQVIATKLATSALVQKGAAEKGLMMTDLATLGVTKLLTLGFYGLVSAIKTAIATMWTFMTTTPIGWILLAVGAVVALGAAFSAIYKSADELQEELDGFKSELSDIRSELDSVNQELEKTSDRMSELLAKEKLTFEEQEELDRLRETNDELERRKDLLEAEETYKSGFVGRQAAEVVDKLKWEVMDGGSGLYSAEDEFYNQIDDYKVIKQKLDNADTIKEREKYQKKLDKKADIIDGYLMSVSEALDGVEYGDSEQSDIALDYLAEIQDNYAIVRGDSGAKTNAVKDTFKKPEFQSMSKAIDYYVEALKNGDESAAEFIAEIINNNTDLVEDLKARGLEAQDAIDHFTRLGENAQFDTIEGKAEEIKEVTEKLPEAFNNISHFMDGDKVDKTVIAEYFKTTSDKTREEIAKLVQDINDGKIDVEHALQKFDLFGVQSVLEIEITEVQTNFKDTFTDLENADGLIDTFQELADAIGSTSNALDALNAAQAEMDYSGRVSIETALKLMESTDDYSKVLTISEGKLILAENAEENLIDARLESMKASALKALEDARAARETIVLSKSNAEAALSTYNSAMETEISAAVTASAWDKVLAAAAGLLAGIKSLFTDESWTEAYDRAYQEVLNSRGQSRVAEVNAKYTSVEEKAKRAQLEKDLKSADQSIEEQDKEIERLQGNYDLINGLNKDNIQDVFKSDGFDDPDDVVYDAFQKAMDYWENRIGANQAKYEQIQNEIDLLEAKGQKAGKEYYQEQMKLEEQRRDLLELQKAEAATYLTTLEEGSEEWWEVANTLNDIEGELDDVTASIVDLQDAMAEVEWYKFEEFNNRLGDIMDKLGTIRDLIAPDGEEDWFDDQGQWTEEGVAVLGTYIQELATYEDGLKRAGDALTDFTEKQYAGNESWFAENYGIHSEQEYYDKQEELMDQQYEYAESISDTEQSIVDMYESNIDALEEYFDTLVDAYNDYIDAVKEALDAERDLYDFKKNVQKQTKDIADLERRIASLSGSTNKADIAERRKLEAQLYESRESLNDTYYDHAKESQQNALDAEAEAYEENMTKVIEGLRTSLETATANMDEFLMGVTSMVMYNADTVLNKYEETNLPLTKELTNPWEEAKKAVSGYSGDALALMNEWTKDGGFFAQFNATGTSHLTSPWSAGINAATNFKTDVGDVMSGVVANISQNVQTASGELSKLYQQIIETEKKAASANVKPPYTPPVVPPPSSYTPPAKTYSATAYLKIGNDVYSAPGTGTTLSAAQSMAKDEVIQVAYNSYKARGYDDAWLDKRYSTWKSNVTFTNPGGGFTFLSDGSARTSGSSGRYSMYASGTSGTKRDEWAITDEPQFGDELTMYATPEGTLSFMRAGSTVVPADITANLVEWGKLTPDMLNVNGTPNINMISNAVHKPELNITFDSLVKAENITEETLPAVKKLVTQELNKFTKELNYALKGKGAR